MEFSNYNICMAKRKLNVKKMIIRLGIILIVIIGLIFALFYIGNKTIKKSANDGAKKYKNKSCTIYYPNNSEFKKYAKEICGNGDIEITYDYALVPYGDYYLVTYSNGTKFFMDKENNPLVIDGLTNECREVVSDYLRYDMQKEDLDSAYTLDFYEKTYYNNLDLSNAKVELNGVNISVYLEEFDRTITFPIFDVQKYLNLNLGTVKQKYVRPHFVSDKRKTIVFTFNDGPSTKYSPKLIDELYRYGANATFFIQGNKINQEAVDMIEDSIEKGNEYGSHTENNIDLSKLDDKEVYNEIMSPANTLLDGSKSEELEVKGIGYSMKFYRPPYGIRNETIDAISPLTAVLWDIDAEDWLYRDEEHLYNYLMELDEEGKLNRRIVIMHDAYSESVDAAVRAIKELAGKGYQFVNLSEFFDLIDFDYSKKYY